MPNQFHGVNPKREFDVPGTNVSISLLVKRIWQRLVDEDCANLAAQMSFYFLLSLFPFFLIVASVVGWLPSTTLWDRLVTWMTQYLPVESRTLLIATMLDLSRGHLGFLSLGLLTTVWSAASGFMSFMESLSRLYGIRDTRGYWKRRAIASVATIVAAVFLLGSFALLSLGRWAGKEIWVDVGAGSVLPVVLLLLRWLGTLCLMCLGLDLLHYFLPDVKAREWRWLTPGNVFVAMTFVVGTVGFNFYVRYFGNYSSVYGTLAGFFILMLWVYMANIILLVGAEADHQLSGIRDNELAA
jgi:membrane protein